MNRMIIALVALLLLSACVSNPAVKVDGRAQHDAVMEQRKRTLLNFNRWELNGRLNLRQDNSAVTLGIEWKQDGDKLTIKLFDVLGRQVLQLEGDTVLVDLIDQRGKRYTGIDPNSLLDEQIGSSIPINQLAYWVKALSSPEVIIMREEYDQYGRLQRVEQADWGVQFARYFSSDILSLPKLIVAEHQTIKLKLLIDSFN